MRPMEKRYFEGPEMVPALEDMLEKARAGELTCVAFWVFKTNGEWEDVAIGGTEEDRARLLAKLRENH